MPAPHGRGGPPSPQNTDKHRQIPTSLASLPCAPRIPPPDARLARDPPQGARQCAQPPDIVHIMLCSRPTAPPAPPGRAPASAPSRLILFILCSFQGGRLPHGPALDSPTSAMSKLP